MLRKRCRGSNPFSRSNSIIRRLVVREGSLSILMLKKGVYSQFINFVLPFSDSDVALT